jgi:hypothetical protein
MSFFKDVLGSVASIAGPVLGSYLGKEMGPSQREVNADQRELNAQMNTYARENAVLGRDLDIQGQQEMFDFRLNRAREAGLTNVEAFGSPAAGAGGGTSNIGATLGNSAAALGAQRAKAAADNALSMRQLSMQTATGLAQTKMQTDAQRDVAAIQAGATTGAAATSADASRYQADINKAIAEGRLDLDTKAYRANVRLINSKIKVNAQNIEKAIHDTATADPKFVTAMKQLSMGPANLLVELTMRHHGIALNDGSFKALPKETRSKILAEILALSSTTYVEGQGASALGDKVGEGAENLIDQIWRIIKNPLGFHEPIEATTPQPPKLGARMYEPFRSAPDMRTR